MISGSKWSIKEVNHEKMDDPASSSMLLRQYTLGGVERLHIKQIGINYNTQKEHKKNRSKVLLTRDSTARG